MIKLNIAGVDEAGRGALAGPVVSAAVLLAAKTQIPGLTDSKRLSAKQRSALEGVIKAASLSWAVGLASVDEIDEMNILQATLLSMQRAVEGLEQCPDQVLVDGNRLPNLDCPAKAIVKGDLLVPAISAASVIAKVTRDSIMAEYSNEYPNYGFERHAGYGTRVHLESLASFGATAIHRKTFAPVRNLAQTEIAL